MSGTPPAIDLRIPGLSRPVSMRVHGEADRHISRHLRERGVWEPFETTLLLGSLEAGDVFLDVGANIGYYSVIAAGLVGNHGAVLAFEPDPDNFRLLQDNIERNACDGTVSAFEAGLSGCTGRGMLYLSTDNLGDHQVFDTGEQRSCRPIQLYHGSEFLHNRVSRLDLLKVDVQGAEYAVLSGLVPLLQGLTRLPRMIIELTPLSLRQAGSSGRALIELLAGFDEPMWIIDHIEHRLVSCTAEELAVWCDNVDAVPGDAGFMNILVGRPVPGVT